ncbi:MAG: hypothetical protein JNL72_05945 [Flavipsychrobacter sp.]|nr:hypothetical protein [Flavipsychrobacter sp.]
MRKKFTSYVVVAALLAFCGFSTVTYTSCKDKGFTSMGCDTMQCLNWGTCSEGKCTCPSGFDGADCGIAIAQKFIDPRWSANEVVVGSSNAVWVGASASYTIRTRAGYTATSFFIDSVLNDRYKSNILCEITSPTTFDIQYFQPTNDPSVFKIMGGNGSVDTAGVDKMTGEYYRFVVDSTGTHSDTVEFTFINN